jgi:hypothetical protein
MALSFVVSTTAIDCRTSQLGHSGYATARLPAGVSFFATMFVERCPILCDESFPIFRSMQPRLAFISYTYIWFSLVAPFTLNGSALTFVTVLGSLLSIDVLMTSRFHNPNARIYLRYLHRCVTGT